MQTGNWLTRMFAFPPKKPGAKKPGEDEEQGAAAQPQPGAAPDSQPVLRAPTLSPDGEDVAALKHAEEQKALLPAVGNLFSPYTTWMLNYGDVRYNPDDLLNRKGFDIYKKMMIDEQVKAVVRFKQAAVLSRGWELYYPEDSELSPEEQQERIRIVNVGLRRMGGSFQTGLRVVLRSLWQGFSITEKEHQRYEYKGKTWIGLKALLMRPFDSIFFKSDEHGHIEKCVQRIGGQDEIELPLNRFVYHVHNADMDPHYGQSDLREAYRAYFTKDMAIRFGNIHMERMAGGMVFLEPEVGISITPNSPEYVALEALLKNLSASTGALLPRGVKANVVHPATTDVFKLAIEAQNLAIAKALLVPNLLGITETGQTGTYSQSQTQFEAFLWTLDETAGGLEETLTEQVFRELGRANFADAEGPLFRLKPMSDAQKDAILKQWGELLKSGAVEASDTDEKHVRKLMEFPEKGIPVAKPPVILGPDGKPLPAPPGGAPLGPDGKPIEPKLGPDGKPLPSEEEEADPNKRPPMDETVRGTKVRVHSHGTQRRRYTAGEKRFNFQLAKKKTENIEDAAGRALHSAIKSGVAGMAASVRRFGPDALQMGLSFDTNSTSMVKRAIKNGMTEAVELGIKLAADETKELPAAGSPREVTLKISAG